MSQPVRGKLLTALGALWVLCLGGLGCSAQVSFSFLNGTPAPAPATTLRHTDPAAVHAVASTSLPEIVRTSYQTTDPSGKTALAATTKVLVTPEPAPMPSGPEPLSAFSDPVPENVPTPTVPDLQPISRPAAPDGQAAPTPTTPSVLDLRPGREPCAGPSTAAEPELNLVDLPEFNPPETQRVPTKATPGTLPVSAPESRPIDPILDPTAVAPTHQPLALSGPPAPHPDCPTRNQAAGPANEGDRPVPTESAMVTHPPYKIEPPDILLVDTIRMIPRPPYTVQPLDVLLVRVAETLPNQPIDSAFVVAPDGMIDLGHSYGLVGVAGMSLEMVQAAITTHLTRKASLRNPQVSVGLGQFRGMQQLRGEHLVHQDGTISLGTYGCVYVTGMTILQAKYAIEQHLSQFLLDPEVSLDVFAYNSKVYYIIADGAGFEQQVFRFPITGKEKVLDAISQIQGLPGVASARHIWLARPTPADHACVQVLPVDWRAIIQGGSPATNYELFPGDRIYIKFDSPMRFDNAIAKIVAPIERLMGVTLLGGPTVQINHFNNNNGNGAAAVIP